MISYFRRLLETIAKSVESMDEAVFCRLVDESVEALNKGNKIVVSGLGKNVPVCEKFVGTMNSLGQNAMFMNTNSAVHGDLGMVRPGDLVIVLTKSGETVESIYLAKLLKDRGADLWLLSFQQESTLSHSIPKHLILCLEDEGDLWNIVPNNSTTINLIILQGTAIEIARRRGVTLQDFKQNHPGGFIGESLKNV